MAQAPIWPVATDAFIADTTGLSAEETGAYVMLLICLWRNNGEGLKLDHIRLSRMARVSQSRWSKVWDSIEQFFIIEGDLISQKRIQLDYVRVKEKIDKNRRAGSIGGLAKSLNLKKQQLADANETLENISSEPSSKRCSEKLPIHEPLTIKKKKEISKEKDLEKIFDDRVWNICLKKIAYRKVKQKFISLCKKEDCDLIIKGWETAISHWQAEGTEQQYIPNPLTWFNQMRWTDEYSGNGKGPDLEMWENLISRFIKDPTKWNGHFGAKPGTPDFIREQPKAIVDIYERMSVA